MLDPIYTWLMLQAIAADCATILPANDFHTSLGQTVSVEDVQVDGEGGPLQQIMVGLLEDTQKIKATGTIQYVCQVVIQAVLPPVAGAAQVEAHKARADLRKLYPDRRLFTLDASATFEVTPGAARIVRRPEGADYVLVEMDIEAVLTVRL